jgi:predicted GTPase
MLDPTILFWRENWLCTLMSSTNLICNTAGDLSAQAVQRFEKYEDLAAAKVTIEEREEYEQHMKKGTIVYAGVDYEKILRQVK